MAAKKKRKSGKSRRKPKAAGGLWGPKLALASLRVYTGALFLGATWWKVLRPDTALDQTLRDFAEQEYVPLVERAIAQPPEVLGWRMQWYADLLENVMLPGNAPYVFGTAFLVLEALLGISLVLGACVRLFAMLGAGLMLGFGLAKALPFLTVTRGSNWLLLMILVTLALTAAGRIWGLDARLTKRLPRWIS